MKIEEAKQHIENHLQEGDELVGFFSAQSPFPIWWVLLLGPLGILFLKAYFVAVTKNGINFHRLTLWGKFKDDGDFFNFDEIENVKIKGGVVQRPMIFTLKNGTKIKVKAQIRALAKVANLTEETQKHIEENIASA